MRIPICVAVAGIFAGAALAAETGISPIGARSREEIVSFFTDNMFGRRPAEAGKPARFVFETADRPMDDGKMVRRQVRIVYGGSQGTNSFVVTAFLPTAAKGPVPAFLLVCNRDYAKCCDPERVVRDDYYPVEEIVKRGFAAVSFSAKEVAPDRDTGCTVGVFAAFEESGVKRGAKAWGTISAWAWGASRVMDWLETVPEIDAKRVAIIGHSRGGKTALWAAVTDPRFAMVCVNGSGCSGAKLNHAALPASEGFEQIFGRFPYWFCADFAQWARRDREMPFDQHELLSCVAPRLLAVGSAEADAWAGPDGERRATELARAAWADPSRVDYHRRPGPHDLTLADWEAYLDHAARLRAPTCPVDTSLAFDASASDEFDGAALDETKWWDWVPSFPGRKAGFLFARDNVKVADGRLQLTARLMREDEKTVENLRRGFDTYATALVKAKEKTFYGYYECRAKGMKACVCNAFWLYDPLSDAPERKYRSGDFSEEIDIFEVFGKVGTIADSGCERTLYTTVHRLGTPYVEGVAYGSVESLPNKFRTQKVDFDFWDGYHTYGFLWTETELKWFADGKEMFSRPNDFFHRPMHVTFDCEIMYPWTGEPDKADLPQVFSVDYFRHWKRP